MSEQWLVNGEQLIEFLSDQLVKETGAFSKGVNKGLNIARSAIHNPDAVKPIDPEELPIVLELEEKVRELQDRLHYLDFWVEQKKHVEESARQDQAALKVMRKRYEITVGELRAALSKAVAEKEAAEALLAEYSGVDGCKTIKTCFGYPLDEVQRLVEADKAAKLQRAVKGDDSDESAQETAGKRLP